MVLSVENLEQDFAGKKVLSEISFSVGEGEFACLTGPSGCGKTTMLKILAGLLPYSSGQVNQTGQNLPAQDIGFVFQEGALFPWLTLAENVAFGLKMHKIPAAQHDKLVKDALLLVGLKDAGQLYPRQISGGMKLRAAIARAMVYHPSILLMDEPLGALDFHTRSRMQGELLKIWQKERITVLMVTHNIDELVYMGTRAIVLSSPPSSIKADIPIDLPQPRQRTSVEFNAIRKKILDLLE